MKFAFIILGVIALIAAFAIIIKLIAGAVAIVSGAFNTIIALAVIAALIIIVVWMFSYARRHH